MLDRGNRSCKWFFLSFLFAEMYDFMVRCSVSIYLLVSLLFLFFSGPSKISGGNIPCVDFFLCALIRIATMFLSFLFLFSLFLTHIKKQIKWLAPCFISLLSSCGVHDLIRVVKALIVEFSELCDFKTPLPYQTSCNYESSLFPFPFFFRVYPDVGGVVLSENHGV